MNLNLVQITSCVLIQMLKHRTDIFQTWFYSESVSLLSRLNPEIFWFAIVTVNTVTRFKIHILGLN